jgi:hypothetical protein
MTVPPSPLGPGVFDHIVREDGEEKEVRVVEGHLLVCVGCCCGNVGRGHPPVPVDRFKHEWKRRGVRGRFHLTIAGCLGPRSVRNVVLPIYQEHTLWFHSINHESDVVRLYDYVEGLLARDRFDAPCGPLAEKVLQRYEPDASCGGDGLVDPGCEGRVVP